MKSKPIKLLLIEDDQMLVDIYTTKFKQAGYNYKQAGDGEAGIKEAGDFVPDIILLDIILPKKDGFTVLEALKKNKKTENVPVILLTNLGQEHDIKKGLALGVKSYLTKTNCTPTQVVAEIEKIISASKKAGV